MLNHLIERIITINHAWKLSRESFGNDFPATKSFRDIKSSLQATILREYPSEVYIVEATDSVEHGEDMYSVRLKESILINGVLRKDAEHLPVRIAKDIFTPQELTQFLK